MHRSFASLLLICATFIVAPHTASAAPITVPTGLNPGDQYRLVFVTSTTRDATSSDIADYNAFVTTAANSEPALAALGTTWRAIASTGTVDARDNTGTNSVTDAVGVPIYGLNAALLAPTNDVLWNTAMVINPLLSIITLETGNDAPVGQAVWTGTYFDGTKFWPLTNNDDSQTGITGTSSYRWVLNDLQIQDSHVANRLYAMSDILTVVPEPSTIVQACLAATGLAVSALRRRRQRKFPRV